MTAEALRVLLAENPLTLLYFTSPTCSVCKVLRPKVEALVAENPLWHFEYINTEESREIAGQSLIFAVPTLLFMVEGREITRHSRHFGMHDLEKILNRYSKIYGESS